jgi:hypothetical protein
MYGRCFVHIGIFSCRLCALKPAKPKNYPTGVGGFTLPLAERRDEEGDALPQG